MRTTARVSGSITLIDADCLFATQTRPSGAIASARGAVPTVISASRVRATTSSTLTELLSALTTQACGLPAAGWRATRLADTDGARAVSGRCTACTIVSVAVPPRSSVTVTRT